MHSGYEIQQPEPEISPDYGPPGSLPQTHVILDQRHLFHLDQPNHFFPATHHYAAGGSYFPAVNFKLGLNNNNNNYSSTYKDADVSIINGRGEANVRHGSERFEVPEARQPSLEMLHCWQNQQDSSIKQPPPFWEHLTILPEESNENSAMIIEKRLPHQHLCELEAIYNKPLVSPCEINEEEEEESNEKKINKNKTNKKKKRKKRSIRNVMAEFFGSLVKQVIEHQEIMHERFAEAMERMEEERKARDEDWRKREAERMQRESEEREREKKSAEGREAVIVSYLEKITGERIVGNK